MDLTLILDKIPNPDESVKADNAWISPGGGAVNYSVACSKYGHKPYLIGVTTYLYKNLGLLDEIRKNNVETKGVKIQETNSPGLATIIQVKGEQRRIISYRGANKLLSPNIIIETLSIIPKPDIIQFSSVTPDIIVETISRFDKGNTIVAYDPGSETTYVREKITKTFRYIDILFLNKTEANTIFGSDFEGKLASYSDHIMIILKKGPEGAEAFYKGIHYSQPSIKVDVIDTTGAGDVFNAVFNSTYLETHNINTSLKKAVVAGALKTTKKGSSTAPTREEIEAYISIE